MEKTPRRKYEKDAPPGRLYSLNMNRFLPLTLAEARQRGWDELDVVLVTGDAYVDHPAFGTAIIGRVLAQAGYRVGIIAMPDWRDPASVTVFGRPRLFFGVTSGNLDSMLARYTAFQRYRRDDPYVPGGLAGRKPERAVLVYGNLIKAAYKDVPLILGGVEASMRRIAHYDFWRAAVRRSIIVDARADALVYGMGELAIQHLADRIAGFDGARAQLADAFDGIPGTVRLSRTAPSDGRLLPAEEAVLQSQRAFLECYRLFYQHQRERLVQPTGARFLIHEPMRPLTPPELDAVYALPFTRQPHPSYREKIPAFEMIRHSVTAHRGCVSGCSFCALALHQGKQIVSRSPASILREVQTIAGARDFTGQITDIGGPSANMYGVHCQRAWNCGRESCLFPKLCPNLQINTAAWLRLLHDAAQIQGVKKVTVGSGIRFDLLMREPQARQLLAELIAQHISGQLKIAPEHTDVTVLRAMRKTLLVELAEFVTLFREITAQQGKAQYPLPYLMSCHPGATTRNMQTLKQDVQRLFGYVPEQVQAFIPLPMTLSSVIYYTGVDPLTGERFDVTRDPAERRRQHDIFFAAPGHQRSPQRRPPTTRR